MLSCEAIVAKETWISLALNCGKWLLGKGQRSICLNLSDLENELVLIKGCAVSVIGKSVSFYAYIKSKVDNGYKCSTSDLSSV